MTAADPHLIVHRDEDDLARWVRKRAEKAAPLLQRLGLQPSEFLRSEVGFLACLSRFKDAPLELAPFQVRFLAAAAERFRSLLKSRQVGYSFVMAAEILARCHLRARHVAVCVSYNLDDAKEKISLIKELHDELPLEYQKKLVIDSKTEVGFESRTSKRRISRAISFPSKAPRGKSGDVYIDEFAHCLGDKAIYQGATAVTIRSKGQLTIGSTPWGQRGMFYRIHEQTDEEFGTFWRQDVPWWLCPNFCRDVALAAREAPGMETEARVEKFGTRELVDQFGSNIIDDFKQEYELDFQDERVAFFHHDLILACCHKDRSDRDSKTEVRVHDSVESLAVEDDLGPLYAGYDVGRTKHPSELAIFEKKGDTYILRYQESLRDAPFERQKGLLSRVISGLGMKLRALRIDATGMGSNLAEDLRRRHGVKVEPWVFTNAIKADLLQGLKILFESRAIDLPKDRDTISQLGSVKQKYTEAGNTIFDVDKNSRHHADRVMAMALACWQKRKRKQGAVDVGIRILGERPTIVVPESLPAHALPDVDVEDALNVPDDQFTPRRPEFVPDSMRPL